MSGLEPTKKIKLSNEDSKTIKVENKYPYGCIEDFRSVHESIKPHIHHTPLL